MAKFKTGKVAYIIDGEWRTTGWEAGTAFVCSERTELIDSAVGDHAVICLADNSLLFCKIQQGSRSKKYNLTVVVNLVMADSLIKWAEPVIAALPPGELDHIRRHDPDEYFRLVACHPVPVLNVGEAGRAFFADQRLRA